MNHAENIHRILASGERIPVAVLGATGMVGQVFVHLLADHPRFQLAALCASERNTGLTYEKACRWQLPVPMPDAVRNRELETANPAQLTATRTPIVFSALPAEQAALVEPDLAAGGIAVFSNAGAMRTHPDVPVLIPDVNPGSLSLIEKQGWPETGFVVTNANCAVTGLASALAPLRPLGIETVHLSTCQSVSGAGYPGLSAMDIQDNAIPFIANEEEKIARELDKILDQSIRTFVTAVRVPVRFGHLETVWVSFREPVTTTAVRQAWANHTVPELPSMPERPVVYLEDPDQPQPRNSFSGTPAGMPVFTGRLREQNGQIGFVLLVNNIVKGAAGGSVANGELFLSVLEQAQKNGAQGRS